MIVPQHLSAGICFQKSLDSMNELIADSSGQTPLFYAVHCGNERSVRQLVKHTKLLSDTDGDGRNVLAIAVGRGNPKIVQDIIGAGSDICCKDSEGISSIHLATKCNNEIMKAVYSKLTVHNVDISDACGRTALHWAAAQANEAACKTLLQAGANTSKLDHHRRTALHWLAVTEKFENTPEIANLFLRTYPDLVRWQDVRGATPFHLAACSGNIRLLATLMEFSDVETINRTDNLFRTPLHYACSLGRTSIVRLLMEAGANLKMVDTEGASPVHLAAYWNHPDCILAIAEQSGAPSLTLLDSAGLSPLYWAVQRRNFDAAKCILSQSATCSNSLLLIAAANGDDAMVDLLLSFGARVDGYIDSKTSSTPLICAASHGHVTVMMTLIFRGKADPKQVDVRQRTALHWAAMSGSAEACKFLLGVGCPHDAVEYLGCTALHCAAFSSAECVKVLLQVLPVDCRDRYGFTPLHWACLGRNASCAKNLLIAGAKVNALGRTRDRQTPLDCALRRNATEVAELLVNAGGKTSHGLRQYAATIIQSVWRAFRVRRTVKVVKRHELRLAKERNLRSLMDDEQHSPFADGIVDAVYYGMGKVQDSADHSITEKHDGDSAAMKETKLSVKQSTAFGTEDEVGPPLIDASSSESNTAGHRDVPSGFKAALSRVASTSASRIAKSGETVNETEDLNSGQAEGEDKIMSMSTLASVITMAKKNKEVRRRRYSLFGVVNDDETEDFCDDDDEDLTPQELKQKYYRMSEEQIILQEAANFRKLRVAEMERVEAVRRRFQAATIIQRSWKRYKKRKKNTQTQKLTARQMRLRAGEHAWRRQMAAITLQNAWRKHHRNEVLKTVEKHQELQQVQSPLSSLMRSTRQAVLVSNIYGKSGTFALPSRPQTAVQKPPPTRPSVKGMNDVSKPRPAAISFNFAHRQYTSPVNTAVSQTFRH